MFSSLSKMENSLEKPLNPNIRISLPVHDPVIGKKENAIIRRFCKTFLFHFGKSTLEHLFFLQDIFTEKETSYFFFP